MTTQLTEKYLKSALKKGLKNNKDANYASICKVVEGLSELQTVFEQRKKGNALSGHFISLADVFREYQQAILDILDVTTAVQKRNRGKTFTPVKFINPSPNRNSNIVIDDGCSGCTKEEQDRYNSKINYKKTTNTSGSKVKEQYRKKEEVAVKQAKEEVANLNVGEVGSKVSSVIKQVHVTTTDNVPLDERIDFDNNAPKTWNDVFHAFAGDHNNLYNYAMILQVKNVKLEMSATTLAKAIFSYLEQEGLTDSI